ncbi:MAG: SCO family protein [Candidatus Tumulicola sp.]
MRTDVIPTASPAAGRGGRILGAAMLLAILAGCAPNAVVAPGFTLTSDENQPWSLAAQRGHSVLLTFGFTHCADTCPATLAKLARLTRPLAHGASVEIAMVTVDPRRDTPPVLHRFVARFERPIIGLTGTPKQIAAVESAYHVWAQRTPGAHVSPRGYDVAHSAVIYAIDARGAIRAISNDDDSQAALTGVVRELTN